MGESMAQRLAASAGWEQWRSDELAELEYLWPFWARPEQKTPPGDWQVWLFLAGRGAGKTRSAAEDIRAYVDAGKGNERIALVGATAADTRDVMVMGESGLLNVFPPAQRPRYESSKRRVVFHTGATATLYSAEEPDRLRGPQHHRAWCDELAAWSKLEDTWSNLVFGLRLGSKPQVVITTTPRPLDMLRDFVKRANEGDDSVVVTRGKTLDNTALPERFRQDVIRQYQGTRLGLQEMEGEILEPIGALFQREWFRRVPAPEKLQRVVVAIDPAISTRNDETGIVVVGRNGSNAFVLEDRSGMHTPDEWARIAIDCRDRWRNRAAFVELFAEVNRGGDLVKATLRQMDPLVHLVEDRAFKGKDTRAEPCAALYEQGRVFHCGTFPKLEDQMLTFDPTGQDELRARKRATSPDRLDALVWAVKRLGFHRGAPTYTPERAGARRF